MKSPEEMQTRLGNRVSGIGVKGFIMVSFFRGLPIYLWLVGNGGMEVIEL